MRKILLVPIYCALLSTLLYFAQGGFGGGHGQFDFVIYCLGLPAVIYGDRLIDMLPSTSPGDDLINIIWLPAAANLITIWLPIFLVASMLRKKKSNPTT